MSDQHSDSANVTPAARTRRSAGTPAAHSTRDNILAAATPLFAERGYAGTSVRAVADAAGVNVATLAYHFGDKRGLYVTAVQALHAALAELVFVPDPEAPLRSLMQTLWNFLRKHRVAVRLAHRHLVDEGAHLDEVVSHWTNPLMERGTAVVMGFKPDWPESEARFTVASVTHLLVRFSLDPIDQLSAALGCPQDEVDAAVVAYLTRMLARALELPVSRS